jgi:AraC-like DNA-binding protein
LAHSPFEQTNEMERLVAACDADLVLVRRTFAFWQASRRVHGTIMWGRPSEDDVIAMANVWDAHITSPFGADPTLTDIRGLEAVDLLAFERLVRTFGERRQAWTKRAGQQAILHAGGLTGAVILGALQLAASGYELASFDSQDAAFGWIARAEVGPSYTLLRASLLDAPDVVRRLRAALDEDPGTRSANELARKLGLSVRSLQRHLASEGTSLRAERMRHVVVRAERLLEGTELDLTAIAAMLELGSPARLVTLFRSVRGTTPGAYRAQRQSAPD